MNTRTRCLGSRFAVILAAGVAVLTATTQGVAADSFLWALQAGGSGSDEGRGIATDSKGNRLVTGVFTGAATFGAGEPKETTLVSAGGDDIFLAKYTRDGALLWAKRAGGSGGDVGNAVAVDASDRVLVVGQFAETAIFGAGEPRATTLKSIGETDIFVAKFAANGSLLWVKRNGTRDFDAAKGVAVDASANPLVVAGGLVAKYAPNGALIWAQTVHADLEGIAADATGNVLVTGSRDERGDIFLAKLDPDGSLLWETSAGDGGCGEDKGVGVAADPAGHVLVAGYFHNNADWRSPVTFRDDSNPVNFWSCAGPNGGQCSVRSFVAKYDSSGALLWVHASAGYPPDTPSQTGTGVAADALGNGFVTGFYEQPEYEVPPCPFTEIYSSDGFLKWTAQAECTDGAGGAGIAVDSDGDSSLTGGFTALATFGAGEPNEATLVSATDADMFMATYAGPSVALGALSVSHEWSNLCAKGLSDDSVVLLGPPSYNGGDPGVVRMRAAAASDCPYQVRFQEWDYRARDFGDTRHTSERVSYIGLSPGVYRLGHVDPYCGDSIWEVGRFTLDGTGNWKPVSFQSDFPVAPALFLTMQTANGGQAATVRARDVGPDGFEAAIFEEERLMDGHVPEVIGYLAIHKYEYDECDRARLSGTELPYSLYRTRANHQWTETETSVPIDSCSAGGVDLENNAISLQIKLEEERSLDNEIWHSYEDLDVVRIGAQTFAQQVSSYGQDTTALRRK